MTDEQQAPDQPEEAAVPEAEAPEAPAVPEAAEAEASAAEAPAAEAATAEAPTAEAEAPESAAAAAVPGESSEGEEAAPMPARRRSRRDVGHGQAHIRASFNNTIISITDLEGNSLAWTSGGSVGFKGSRESTPYAAQVAAEQAARRAGEFGVRKLDVIVRGSGAGRETAVRTLQNMGMEVTRIVDITPTPHNGCRPKKKRRG